MGTASFTRTRRFHVLYAFGSEFYGPEIRVLVAGLIIEEKDYLEDI